jgi:hypothetical protein
MYVERVKEDMVEDFKRWGREGEEREGATNAISLEIVNGCHA